MVIIFILIYNTIIIIHLYIDLIRFNKRKRIKKKKKINHLFDVHFIFFVAFLLLIASCWLIHKTPRKVPIIISPTSIIKIGINTPTLGLKGNNISSRRYMWF